MDETRRRGLEKVAGSRARSQFVACGTEIPLRPAAGRGPALADAGATVPAAPTLSTLAQSLLTTMKCHYNNYYQSKRMIMVMATSILISDGMVASNNFSKKFFLSSSEENLYQRHQQY